MRKVLGLCAITAVAFGAYRFNLLATIPAGAFYWYVPAGDWNHNGYGELAFFNVEVVGWDIWQCVPGGWFQLVRSDSVVDPHFIPAVPGDFDRNDLADIVGISTSKVDTGRVHPHILEVYESPAAESLPDRLVWSQTYDADSGGVYSDDQLLAYDVDHDGRQEILVHEMSQSRLHLFRNTGIHTYERSIVQDVPLISANWYGMTAGDYSRDGRTHLVLSGSDGTVSDYLYTQADTFACVWQDTFRHWLAQTYDIFSSQGTTADSIPEFFVSWPLFTGPDIVDWYLDRYGSDGRGGYRRVPVDSVLNHPRAEGEGHSCCADVDRDRLDEVIWSLGNGVRVYKATSADGYECVWTYQIPHSPGLITGASATAYDFNHDGYPEIAISREEATRFFEIDTTQLPGIAERRPGRFSPALRVSPSLTRGPVQVTVSTGASPDASLAVYDGTGRQVRLLHDGGVSSGELRLIWDGTDGQGSRVAPGVYFFRLRAASFSCCGKVVVER